MTGFEFETGEVLLIDKPRQWTSFDVIGKLRTIIRKHAGLRKIKIGHAGTLDPLATGLLIVCTGRFTKRITEFQDLEKEYTGTFRLGSTTPSFDLETEPDLFFPVDGVDEPQILKAAGCFTGTFDQVPPGFSAKKVDGKRAYQYARKSIDVEIKPNRITVPMFGISRVDLPDVDFRIVCSKGTYIRALARDFGEHLGCGAHLAALCRTRIGEYHLRDAWNLDRLEQAIRDSCNAAGSNPETEKL